MQHKNLTQKRWSNFTLFEQLGNIGIEVTRAINAKTKEDKKLAGYRALELLDLTLLDNKFKTKNGRYEITRAREVVCDYLFCNNEYKSTKDSLEKYFMDFAIAARLNK